MLLGSETALCIKRYLVSRRINGTPYSGNFMAHGTLPDYTFGSDGIMQGRQRPPPSSIACAGLHPDVLSFGNRLRRAA